LLAQIARHDLTAEQNEAKEQYDREAAPELPRATARYPASFHLQLAFDPQKFGAQPPGRYPPPLSLVPLGLLACACLPVPTRAYCTCGISRYTWYSAAGRGSGRRPAPFPSSIDLYEPGA